MEFKQDMPPSGGYAPITYQRIPLKKWSSFTKLSVAAALMAAGIYRYHRHKDLTINEQIEMKCGSIALIPMIQAEVDRMKLKQLKANRDCEEEVMKDVEGWELGKWKNLPVYATLGPDEYFKPCPEEYYAHAEKIYQNYPFFIFRTS